MSTLRSFDSPCGRTQMTTEQRDSVDGSSVECVDGGADELISRHLRLCDAVVGSVAARFPRHADRDELAQAARLGLVEAARRYQPDRGVPFERWAALRIRGAILDAVRAVDFAPRALRHALRDADAARETLEHDLGRTPTTAELAAHLGLSPAELCALEGRAHRALLVSLDAVTARDRDGGGGAELPDAGHPDPLVLLERLERACYVRDALALLPDRLRDVVVSYFLEGETSASIAARLGITESRVSQLRTEALGLLRAAVEAQYGEAAELPERHAGFAAEVGRRSTFRTRVSLTA
jgi:RNA polymerase sigma factor for flagellar operon FliA